MAEQCGRMLQTELNRRRRVLDENRAAIARLASDQKRLKKEWKEIAAFMWELKCTVKK